MCDQIVRDVSDLVIDNIGTLATGARRRSANRKNVPSPVLKLFRIACLYNATEAVCGEEIQTDAVAF